MYLAPILDLRHRRHNKERVYFAGFGPHKVDSLYLRKVMAAQDDCRRRHDRLEGDVEWEYCRVVQSEEREMGYDTGWLPY